jgi:hypothetical protein
VNPKIHRIASESHTVLGATGLLAGGFAGILVSAHPVLFTTVAGAQCFALGTTYFCAPPTSAATTVMTDRIHKIPAAFWLPDLRMGGLRRGRKWLIVPLLGWLLVHSWGLYVSSELPIS